ncbi:MAG: PKD domain-containing protein, partial [Actinobacteria bacterium]|nr:PKD domain-containing protein [Actinomycetota bacterium]
DEVIVLTATATNTEGSDDDSIELSWGCDGEENKDPEITEIIIPGGTLYVDSQYDISVEATDPDGDSLNYQWSISAGGGDFEDENSNPTKWNTSDAADTYTLEVIVTDEKGGEDSKSKSVDINPPENIDLPKIVDEGGWLEESGLINPGELACIGDIPGGDSCRGFTSFDITGISGVIVKSATLTLSPRMEFGDTSFFDLIRIDSLEWGENEIDFSLFDIAGEFIQGFGSPDITCSIEELKTELQRAINDGKTRFQIRIYCTPSSNGDGIPDGWDYNQSDINLNIDYVPLG